jgi:hypothetical protein
MAIMLVILIGSSVIIKCALEMSSGERIILQNFMKIRTGHYEIVRFSVRNVRRL